MKKVLGITAGAIIGVIVLLVVIGVAVGAGKTTSAPTAGHTTAAQPAAQTTAPAAPTEAAPNPSGTYHGSCDYTLGRRKAHSPSRRPGMSPVMPEPGQSSGSRSRPVHR